MHLKHLSIVNYKNIHQAELDLSPKINCFIGNNGVGKTNLLDSVYFLALSKSHSCSIDAQCINHDAEFFVLQGNYEDGDTETEIYCGLKRKSRKILKKNKKAYDKVADHIGTIPLVMVSPRDTNLIIGGSEERRKFIDGVISQYDHVYLANLLAYNHALQQRNSLIKGETIDDTLFDILEEQLSDYGNYIYKRRTEFIEKFTPIFQYFYNYISEEKEQVSFGYTSHLQGEYTLEQLLKSHRDRDRLIGYTTKGIHRDDLEMQIEGYPIKNIGSQGQNKTYLIALKLAQFDFLSKLKGKLPMLLFDDIFDKLDAERVQQIIKLMKEDNRFEQIFISDTNREHISDILKQTGSEYKIYTVDKGELTLAESNESIKNE